MADQVENINHLDKHQQLLV